MTAASSPPPLRFGLAYDFRNPAGFDGLTDAALYAAILDQAAWADELGFDQVWLTEHHFVEDGYLPTFVPVAGALAARTRRLRISTDVALLPFHQPLRLAEDLAVLDVLSNGRMELGIGMGYAVHEFAAFGLRRAERVSRTEEAIHILRQAWSARPVNFRGKRFQVEDVAVHPKPVQPGGPPLWMAAQSEAGALRAAAFGMHLLPQGRREVVLDPWRAALRAKGDDPKRDWAQFKPSEIHRMKNYDLWAATSPDAVADFRDPRRIPQQWIIGDVEHCVATLADFVRDYGFTDIVTWGAPPGLAPARMNRSLERVANEVLPRLRALQAAGELS